MAVVTSYGSRIMTGLTSAEIVLADPGEGGGRVKRWTETIAAGAADSATSEYVMARLPSNARIFGNSKIYHSALGSTTTTINIGVFNTTSSVSNITNHSTALNSGIVASTAGVKEFLSSAPGSKWGKRLWEFVSNVSVDPKCQLDIKLTLATTHLSSGTGTITVEIDYACD